MKIWGLALVSIPFSHWGWQHTGFSLPAQCTTTWHQPGLSRGIIVKFQTSATENKQKQERIQYVFQRPTRTYVNMSNLKKPNLWEVSEHSF